MQAGQLTGWAGASVDVDRSAALDLGGRTVSASQVTIDYPFSFIVLQPVARLVARRQLGWQRPRRCGRRRVMRNETQ